MKSLAFAFFALLFTATAASAVPPQAPVAPQAPAVPACACLLGGPCVCGVDCQCLPGYAEGYKLAHDSGKCLVVWVNFIPKPNQLSDDVINCRSADLLGAKPGTAFVFYWERGQLVRRSGVSYWADGLTVNQILAVAQTQTASEYTQAKGIANSYTPGATSCGPNGCSVAGNPVTGVMQGGGGCANGSCGSPATTGRGLFGRR
jgi:hypothetical protein